MIAFRTVAPAHADQESALDAMQHLITHTGKRFVPEIFHDKAVLLTFGFTHCPDICPMELSRIGRVLGETDSSKLSAIFVTLDPERDTVAKLSQYVPYFSDRIVGLTGSVKEITAVAEKIGVRFSKQTLENGYTIDHSTGVYLVGPNGTIEAIAPFGASTRQLADLVSNYTN